MEIVTRKVKGLVKRVGNETPYDLFIYNVLVAFLTNNLSEEQFKIASTLLQKEGYLV